MIGLKYTTANLKPVTAATQVCETALLHHKTASAPSSGRMYLGPLARQNDLLWAKYGFGLVIALFKSTFSLTLI